MEHSLRCDSQTDNSSVAHVATTSRRFGLGVRYRLVGMPCSVRYSFIWRQGGLAKTIRETCAGAAFLLQVSG